MSEQIAFNSAHGGLFVLESLGVVTAVVLGLILVVGSAIILAEIRDAILDNDWWIDHGEVFCCTVLALGLLGILFWIGGARG